MTQETIRGIDHVGIVVPDIDTATTFLTAAFGAKIIYVAVGPDDPPIEGPEVERGTGAAKGSRIVGMRQLRIGTGPTVELIEFRSDDQAPPARVSDLGLNHLSLYADDTQAAIARFEGAGGRMLSQPIVTEVPAERGDGNTFCYGLTPWGMSVEFVSYPSEMGYEVKTDLRRWYRGG